APHLDGFCVPGVTHGEWEVRVKELTRTIPSQAEAHRQLVAAIGAEIARLAEYQKAIEPVAERNLALAAREARAETTPEAMRLSGYIKASYAGSDAALRRLEKLQNPKTPGPGKRPTRDPEPAPGAEAQAPVTGDVPASSAAPSTEDAGAQKRA